jgi:hypothetical protein
VSFLGDEPVPALVAFLLEGEIKMPAAAREFSEQVGQIQGRFGDAVGIQFTANGQIYIVSADRVVFDRGAINRNAITTTTKAGDQYTLKVTDKGGHDEAYLRIGVAVKAEGFRELVDLAIRSMRRP